jgi:hypothetical protein
MTETLHDFLKRFGIIGRGHRQRELVMTYGRRRHARRPEHVDFDTASLVAKAKASPGMSGADLVREVTGSETLYASK